MRNLGLKCIFCAAFLSAGFSLSAHTVSVMVVEKGVNTGSPRIDASSLWEGGLMDVFFDTGHIVSNAPIQRLPEGFSGTFPDEKVLAIAEAREGGAAYYILAVLEYSGRGGEQKDSARPDSVALRFVQIHPHKVLFEERHNGNPALPMIEERESAKRAAKSMLSRL